MTAAILIVSALVIAGLLAILESWLTRREESERLKRLARVLNSENYDAEGYCVWCGSHGEHNCTERT